MKTIIVSAFGPFGKYPANTTQLFARRMHGHVLAGHRVHAYIFDACIPPAEEDRGRILLDAAQSLKASGILALGMSSKKRGFCIELITVNAVHSESYCSPQQNGTPVNPAFPTGKTLSVNLWPWNTISFIQMCARKNISAEYSADPGGFCCNHLMFQLGSRQQSEPQYRDIPWIYIHVPCCPEAVPQPDTDFRSAGRTTMSLGDLTFGLTQLVANAQI